MISIGGVMKLHLILILIHTLMLSLFAQTKMFEKPLSPRLANYQIDVQLNTKTKKLTASEIITWTNKSGDYIPDLQFHMYLNAFKNEQTTFMKESGGRHRTSSLERNGGWGWTQIKKISVRDDVDLVEDIRYIQPDDGNPGDETVVQLMLSEPVKPQETIKIYIEFEAKLPRVFARTGYKGDYFLVGQWFPKIGVYEAAGDRYATAGQWNCHQFHANSEFFADFGVYDVKITLPPEYIVGATGIRVAEKNNNDSTKTVHYYCEDVHDFAWTADTDFTIVEDEWEHVKIKYLVQPLHGYAAHRYVDAARVALEYLEEWCGTYPYPILTIVDPQFRGSGSGGMEYPTFITAGTIWNLPEGIKLAEEVTVHEFAHNYFYGLLASNEFEEAWLDEGMTTYVELKMMDTYYGKSGGSVISLFGLNIMDTQFRYIFYRARAKRDLIFKNSWEYGRGDYGIFSYSKPALMMLTLENYVGPEKMKKIMREYFRRFKFKHPTTRDFIETFNDVTGQDYNWFFDQVIYGTDALDYAIEKISNTRKSDKRNGVFTDPTLLPDTTDEVSSSNDSTKVIKTYASEVIVSREGEVVFPVEILVEFSDGSRLTEKWDGRERYKLLTYDKDARVISAQVDPEQKIWLDVNFLNNGKTAQKISAPKRKYYSRFLFWVQNILHVMSIFS
jgi:hypothetical protein